MSSTHNQTCEVLRVHCELKQQTLVNKGKNTNGNWLGNYPCNTIMHGGLLQCWTLDVQGGGTSFYMPHSIFVWNFQDLNTSIGDIHNLILI
jgi:hypothetical protein